MGSLTCHIRPTQSHINIDDNPFTLDQNQHNSKIQIFKKKKGRMELRKKWKQTP